MSSSPPLIEAFGEVGVGGCAAVVSNSNSAFSSAPSRLILNNPQHIFTSVHLLRKQYFTASVITASKPSPKAEFNKIDNSWDLLDIIFYANPSNQTNQDSEYLPGTYYHHQFNCPIDII
jgi:hypothetical protein